jgi:hypothetical protein
MISGEGYELKKQQDSNHGHNVYTYSVRAFTGVQMAYRYAL